MRPEQLTNRSNHSRLDLRSLPEDNYLHSAVPKYILGMYNDGLWVLWSFVFSTTRYLAQYFTLDGIKAIQ